MNIRISAKGCVIAEGEDLPYGDVEEMVEAAMMMSVNANKGGLRIELGPEPLPPFVPDDGTVTSAEVPPGASKKRKKALQ